MSLYPSLEDMKVDQILKNDQQQKTNQTFTNHAQVNYASTAPDAIYWNREQNAFSDAAASSLYPTMNSYTGLDLTASEIAIIEQQQKQLADLQIAQNKSNEVAMFSNNKAMLAPLSGSSIGLRRAQVTNGIREVILCKDSNKKIGMRCKAINNGIFVVLVTQDSPASLAGLKFGDQILQVNDQYVAGMSHQSLHLFINKLPQDRIVLAVRDRPLERTVTMHKDRGEAGFIFSNGKITSIVKDSSAARNGLLTDNQILEVDGQNVVGLPDNKIREIIQASEYTLTLTIMPSVLFEKIITGTHTSLFKKLMDHSIYDY